MSFPAPIASPASRAGVDLSTTAKAPRSGPGQIAAFGSGPATLENKTAQREAAEQASAPGPDFAALVFPGPEPQDDPLSLEEEGARTAGAASDASIAWPEDRPDDDIIDGLPDWLKAALSTGPVARPTSEDGSRNARTDGPVPSGQAGGHGALRPGDSVPVDTSAQPAGAIAVERRLDGPATSPTPDDVGKPLHATADPAPAGRHASALHGVVPASSGGLTGSASGFIVAQDQVTPTPPDPIEAPAAVAMAGPSAPSQAGLPPLATTVPGTSPITSTPSAGAPANPRTDAGDRRAQPFLSGGGAAAVSAMRSGAPTPNTGETAQASTSLRHGPKWDGAPLMAGPVDHAPPADPTAMQRPELANTQPVLRDGPAIEAAPARDPVSLAQLQATVTQRLTSLMAPLPDAVRTDQVATRTAEVELAPAELGKLKLTLQTTERGLHLVVAVERPEMVETVRRHLETLHRALLSEGVTLDGVDIGAGSQGGDKGAAQAEDAHLSAAESGSPEAEAAGPAPSPRPGPAGHLDLSL